MPRVPKPAMPPPSANRTDLNVPKTVQGPGQPNGVTPSTVPTGLPYGEAKQLADVQRAAPSSPAGGAAQPPAGQGWPPGAGSPPNIGHAIEAAKQMAPPSGALTRPTDRPNEP